LELSNRTDVPVNNPPKINTPTNSTASGANGAKLNKQLTLDEAVDHSFDKHVLKQGEFSGLGIRTKDQLRSHAENVLNNPSSIRYHKNGKIAYIQESTGTVLIKSPVGSSGQSTVFQPKDFQNYINTRLSQRTTPYIKDNQVSPTGN
jgi:hypothetical protein